MQFLQVFHLSAYACLELKFAVVGICILQAYLAFENNSCNVSSGATLLLGHSYLVGIERRYRACSATYSMVTL